MPKRKVLKDSGDGSPVKQSKSTEIQTSSYFPPKCLDKGFYEQSGEDLAKALLGKMLVRMQNGKRLSARIVETEAYLGLTDKAAHSYNNKRTEKTEAMFMKPGTAYVYHIYGLYCCMNISSQGEGCAVLIRVVEPIDGKDTMNLLRWKKGDVGQSGPTGKTKLTKKERDLTNGPSKMCMALDITKGDINKVDMTDNKHIWLENGDPIPDSEIVISKRINIAYAEDWTDKPLRFYILNNPFVSVRDKEAEKKHLI